MATASATVAGALTAVALPASAATPPTGSAGAVDTSFGSNGLATVSLTGATLTSVTTTIVQPDNKVLIAGLQPGVAGSVVVARLTSAGALDTTFGGGKGYVKPGLGSTSTSDSAAIALQPDGKILVGGSVQSGTTGLAAIVRLKADGTTDTSFGANGKTTTTVTGSPLVHISDLLVLSSGTIVASTWAGSSGNLTLLRYTSAGALDKTFGSSGIASVTTAGGVVEGNAVALAKDGTHLIEVGSAKQNGQLDTAIARFNANGTPDTMWPSGGTQTGAVVFELSGSSVDDQANDVAVDPAGNIVLSGTIAGSPSQAYAYRLTSAGNVDSGFGTNGLLRGTFDGAVGTGNGVAVDSAGRALVVGGAAASGSVTNALGIERITSDGGYDPGFGVQGSGATATGTGRESVACPKPTLSSASGAATAVTTGANGQIVVAGWCNGSLVATRLGFGNISNLTMSTSTPTAAAGHGTIPLASTPTDALLASAASLAGAPGFTTPGFTTPGFTTPGFTTPGFTTPGFTTPGFTTPGFTTPGFGVPGFTTPVDQSPLVDPALGQVPLSALPMTPSTGGTTTWNQVLAGTVYDGMPLQSITLQQVLALPAPNPLANVTLGQLDVSATSLRQASLAAYLLGETPSSALPSPCSAIAGQPVNCSNTNVGPLSLLNLELRGDDLRSYYASTSLDVVGVQPVKAPLTFLPLNDVDMSATTLGATKTTQLVHPSRFVTCTPTTSAGNCDTLATAQAAGAIQSSTSVTLLALLNDSPSAVGQLPLANLLLGLISRQNLPIENLDSAGINSFYGASPYPTSGAAYNIAFDLGCDAASSLVVKPALPASFRLIPSTVSMTLGSGSSARSVPVTVASDGTISPAAAPSCTGTQHVNVDLQAEPGVVLDDPTSSGQTAGVTVSVSTDSLSLSNKAPVKVVDNFEPDAAASATTAASGTVYVGHIASAGDTDYYSIQPPLPGSTLTVTLSHVPADYDLLLYGPGSQMLRAIPGFTTPGFTTPGFTTPGFTTPGFTTPGFTTPGFTTPGFTTPAGDSATDFASAGSSTPPTPDGDILRLNEPLRGYSLQRGTVDETVTTKVTDSDTKPFLVQVTGYNGTSSRQPYVLRVSVTPPIGVLPCQTTAPAHRGEGVTTLSMPSTPLPASTQTLILVNQKRFGDYYGLSPSSQIASELNKLAASSAVNGVVVPVERDSAVAGAFSDFDNNPCSVVAANDVVYTVNALIDRLRAGLPDLRYVVIAGNDQLFPMGRVPDKTASFNESRYSASALRESDNPESRAAKLGYVLSDNPYGDVAPQPYLDSQLFVPQLAVGRLVETPSEISATIDACVAASCRTSPGSAFVTGYAPFDKGSQDVATALAGKVAKVSTLIDATPAWTAADAKSGIAASAHGINVVNAHYDNYRALPEKEFLDGNENPANPLSTADLPSDLSGGLAWTIGCHAGLNLPDVYLASPTAAEQAKLLDWAQGELHNGVTGFAGNSGYGLGDTDAIAYSERLSSYFAKNLDGTMSIGQALAFAKQKYAQLGVASVYDAKAIEEMNFYGLPMWQIGASGQSARVVLPTPPTNPSKVVTATSLQTFDASQSGMAFTKGQPSSRGDYYLAGGQAPQVTPNEPIQPRYEFTLPARSDGLVAKGAIVEQLTSHDVANFAPNFDTPVADNAAFNPEPKVTTADFPSQLQAVSGYVDARGRHDSLVVVPGQYVTDAPGGLAPTQRLFDRVDTTVTFSNSPSVVAPQITQVKSAIQGSSATVTVTTPDADVVRGVAMVLVGSSSTSQSAWQHVELVSTGNGSWVGTLTIPSGTTIGSYFAQLQNAAGNVAVSSNKGSDWSLVKGTAFTFALSAQPNAQGLYPDPTTVTITPPAGVTSYTITLDGTATTYSGTAMITISGNGGHVLVASGSGISGSVGIPIDSHPPTFTFTTPTSGSSYAKGSTVQTKFSCTANQVAIQSCSAPTTLDTASGGTKTFTVTAVDAFGVTWTKSVQYVVVDAPPVATITAPPADKSTSVSGSVVWKVSDPDDALSTLSLSCTLDGSSVPCGSPDGFGNGAAAYTGLAPSATAHTFTIKATDSDGKSSQATASWRIFYETRIQVDPAVPNVPLTATVTWVDPTDGSVHPLVSPNNGDEPAAASSNFALDFYSKTGTSSICHVTTSNSAGKYTCGSVTPTASALVSGGVRATVSENVPYATVTGSAGVLS